VNNDIFILVATAPIGSSCGACGGLWGNGDILRMEDLEEATDIVSMKDLEEADMDVVEVVEVEYVIEADKIILILIKI